MYQLVEMVESNVDKEFSCFRVARNSVKASSMAVSIADGSISCVLSKALHVLSQYRCVVYAIQIQIPSVITVMFLIHTASRGIIIQVFILTHF